MFVKILLSRKSLACMAFAVKMWAVQLLSGAAMLVMDFSFVPKETTGVSEAWKFLAPFRRTFVRSVMLIHMLAMKLLSILLSQRG
jgi:hypothetical protein